MFQLRLRTASIAPHSLHFCFATIAIVSRPGFDFGSAPTRLRLTLTCLGFKNIPLEMLRLSLSSGFIVNVCFCSNSGNTSSDKIRDVYLNKIRVMSVHFVVLTICLFFCLPVGNASGRVLVRFHGKTVFILMDFCFFVLHLRQKELSYIKLTYVFWKNRRSLWNVFCAVLVEFCSLFQGKRVNWFRWNLFSMFYTLALEDYWLL